MLLPAASPLALDLLSRMLLFDQYTRISVAVRARVLLRWAAITAVPRVLLL